MMHAPLPPCCGSAPPFVADEPPRRPEGQGWATAPCFRRAAGDDVRGRHAPIRRRDVEGDDPTGPFKGRGTSAAFLAAYRRMEKAARTVLFVTGSGLKGHGRAGRRCGPGTLA